MPRYPASHFDSGPNRPPIPAGPQKVAGFSPDYLADLTPVGVADLLRFPRPIRPGKRKIPSSAKR